MCKKRRHLAALELSPFQTHNHLQTQTPALQVPLQTLPPPAASYSQTTPFPHSARQTRSPAALQMPSVRGQRAVQRDRSRAADQSPSPQTQPAAVVLRTPELQQVGRTTMPVVVAGQVGL